MEQLVVKLIQIGYHSFPSFVRLDAKAVVKEEAVVQTVPCGEG
ncbi:MAG: hypothetical protein ACJASC_002449 [Limimaricola cinnabarinus]|jgi:hypothetical protein